MNSKEIFNLIDYINSLESKLDYYKKMYLFTRDELVKAQLENVKLLDNKKIALNLSSK